MAGQIQPQGGPHNLLRTRLRAQLMYTYIEGLEGGWRLSRQSGMLQRTILQLLNATTNNIYQENQDATTNTDATTQANEYYRPMYHACAHDVSGLPALIRASVIIFVTVCKVQLSVKFSYQFSSVISLVQLSV